MMEEQHRLLEKIKSKVQRLEELISQFDPLDVIANLAYINNIFRKPETDQEPHSEGTPAYVEYCTLLCLKRPYKEGDRSRILGKEIEDIQELIKEIFNDATLYFYREHTPLAEQISTRFKDLRFRIMNYYLTVRYPGYWHHLKILLKELFGEESVKNWMVKHLGFDIDIAVKSVQVIRELMEDRFSERIKNAQEAREYILNELENYKKVGKIKSAKYKSIVEELIKLSPESPSQYLGNYLVASIFSALGDVFTFRADDLSQRVGCEVVEIQKFLDTFSISFGEVDEDFYMPEPVSILQTRPIIKYPKGYFCPDPRLLLWSLRPRIEEKLKADKKFWNKYEKLRHDYSLQKSLKLFEDIFKTKAKIFSNLKYDGNELDGLILFDRNCFLIEVKAGELTPRAKKGFFDRMSRDAKALIMEAHEQALRARNYINSSQVPLFKTEKGQLIFLKGKIDSYFLITVTLDDLAPFSVNIPLLQDIGILLSSQDLPWVIPLLDLQVMSEIIEFPTQFIHYLKRRLRLSEIRELTAMDELDFFMYYLTAGLCFGEEIKDVDYVQLLPATTELDEYYDYATGRGIREVEKPRQQMPELFRKLICELEDMGGEGYTKAIEALLELGDDGRDKLVKMFESRKNQIAIDGKLHDFSLRASVREDNSIGYTWFVTRDAPLGEVYEKLISYCLYKKSQVRANCWVGLVSVIKYPGIIHGWFFNDQLGNSFGNLKGVPGSLLENHDSSTNKHG